MVALSSIGIQADYNCTGSSLAASSSQISTFHSSRRLGSRRDMNDLRKFWGAVVAVLACASVASGASAATGETNATIGAWLAIPDSGFSAWSAGQASVTNQYDYFVCGAKTPTVKPPNFDYAGSACPALMGGTAFSHGSGEPMTGRAVYDRAHSIVLYFKGCCAWRGFALTALTGAPPASVNAADLSGVHTKRGVALGMTPTQVQSMYGQARSYAAKGVSGISVLRYTTMKSKDSTEACGQWQSFSFQKDRLVSIELLAGC
jgi:hypothetical protein